MSLRRYVPAWAKDTARTVRDAARSVAYRGEGRACDVCGHTSRAFLPFGDPGRGRDMAPRPDAKCPHCGSLERHRLAWRYLVDHTDLFDGRDKFVLHIAPEHCLQPRFESRLGASYWSADLFRPNARLKMDITAMPLDDDSVDVVYCSHVLEHIPDDRKAMSEIARVLKPGGWALLVVPLRDADDTYEDFSITTDEGRREAFGQADHVRWYGRDFETRLAEAGLSVTRLDVADVVADPEARLRHGLPDTLEPMWMCRVAG